MPVQCRTRGDFEIGPAWGLQCVDELIEEQWDAGVDFRDRMRALRSGRDPVFASRDDLVAVGEDEFVEHERSAFLQTIVCRHPVGPLSQTEQTTNSGVFSMSRAIHDASATRGLSDAPELAM